MLSINRFLVMRINVQHMTSMELRHNSQDSIRTRSLTHGGRLEAEDLAVSRTLAVRLAPGPAALSPTYLRPCSALPLGEGLADDQDSKKPFAAAT